MEIGSPMAAMYLLQNPDHYTSHKFIPFWWKSFVHHIRNSDSNNNTSIVKLLISQNGKDYIVSSKIDDYKYRPEAYKKLSLYDWTKLS
ncbi:hypothetical protein BYT27DRAFT_7064442, partial [Phlegmacium glaucopus]